MPWASSSSSRESPSQPGKVKWALAGSRPPGRVAAEDRVGDGRADRRRPGRRAGRRSRGRTTRAARRRAGRPPRRRRWRGRRGCRSGHGAPGRRRAGRARGCTRGPAAARRCRTGRRSCGRRRSSRRARRRRSRRGPGRRPGPRRRAAGRRTPRATSASSRTGRTVPISLLAHMTVARATSSGLRAIASRSASGWTRPYASTGRYSTVAPSCSPSQWTASRTAWCSTGLARTRVRAGSASRRDQYRPFTARLSASVPPEVKTTSLGRAPSASARVSRASSTVRRALRPAAWREEALPVTLELGGHRLDRLGKHRGGRGVVEVGHGGADSTGRRCRQCAEAGRLGGRPVLGRPAVVHGVRLGSQAPGDRVGPAA